MPEATIDHMVALVVFLAALLIFTGLFNQTIQTAITYQQHQYLATKCSDLLDNVLINSGSPENWGISNSTPTYFGLQEPNSSGYALSPFSLMRLNPASAPPIYYLKTDMYYGNVTLGFGESMFVPLNEVVNYSTAQTLLGINGTYGFQLTVTPTITVSITQTKSNPLTLAVSASGNGFPLTNANVSYCFLNVSTSAPYPSYSISYGMNVTDGTGSASFNLNGTAQSYALVAYASLYGLVGVGYYENCTDKANYIVPLVSDINTSGSKIILAHSYDILNSGDPAGLNYNATFALLTGDFSLSPQLLAYGTIDSGGQGYGNVTIPTNGTGALIITYMEDSSKSGVVIMPWGASSMAFPVIFGESTTGTNGKEWVASDIRQVSVNGISYQAKLFLWSLQGYPTVK
jgi:Tfp pilus assembly protein PilV